MAPAGKRFRIWAFAIGRIIDGKIVQVRDLADLQSLYQQLGLSSGRG